MVIIDVTFSSPIFWDLGLNCIHVGLLFALGLLLGPFGAIGAIIGIATVDLIEGFAFIDVFYSAVLGFGISYLAYKLWYSSFKTQKITKPRLDSISHLILFLSIILICGFIFSVSQGSLIYALYLYDNRQYIIITYLLNFINSAFIYGIIGIWLSKKIDFIETPKKSKRHPNKKLYPILFYLLIITTVISFITSIVSTDTNIVIGETILIEILLFAYLTKPFESEIEDIDKDTIIEKIIRNFIKITLIIAIFGIVISYLNLNFINHINISFYIIQMPLIIIPDIIIILFFIPGIIILKYIEKKVIKPVSSFSEIESFIKENDKIEADGLLNIYSDYLNEKDEIGNLARSYTDLVNYNNHYII